MWILILGLIDGDGTVKESNLSIYGMDEYTFENVKMFLDAYLDKEGVEVRRKEERKLSKKTNEPYFSLTYESPS